ncbi:MAG: hypothetical protein J0H40_14590 [Rhizobiales bacterium]|nr:hypothetical protein [Hyphomicrobiales bacterium]
MASMGRFERRGFIFWILTVVVGCAGLAWGATQLSRNMASDEFMDIESHLLRFEKFSPTVTRDLLGRTSVRNLSACDIHGQRALLLLEMPLAEAALRTGDVRDFDRHLQSLDRRARETLACAPRDSLVWLIMFGLEVLHGHLDRHSFGLLAMSYKTSQNEAWVSLRRVIVAIPVVLSAPAPLKEKILTEFSDLIRHGFLDIPAAAYLRSSPPVRAMLQSEIEKLPSYSRHNFSSALEKVGR